MAGLLGDSDTIMNPQTYTTPAPTTRAWETVWSAADVLFSAMIFELSDGY